MADYRAAVLGLLGAILAAGTAGAQTSAAFPDRRNPTDAGQDDDGRASSGFRSIADEAFPALGGVRSKAPRKMSGLSRPMSGLPRPRFPQNTRSGWNDGGWPRIPDLPQTRAKIPENNRAAPRVSDDGPQGAPVRPAPPLRDPRTYDDQAERLRKLRESVAAGDRGAIRSVREIDAARDERLQREIDRAERERALERERLRLQGQPVHAPGDADTRLIPDVVLTDLESADQFLREGDYESAAAYYLLHLDDNAADARAARSLAVAMLAADKPKQACRALHEAYLMDPALAGEPLDASLLGRDATLRSLFSRATGYANRAKTPDAWLMAAMLAQAQGRQDVAARFVERARAASLEAPIADAMVSALSKEAVNAQRGGS